MTDKEFAKEKARIERLADKWLQPLGLPWWSVKIEYSRETIDRRTDGRCCVAQTMVDWHYLQATITFDMQAVADETDEDLERYFVHECCHILINEMREWAPEQLEAEKAADAIKHEERVVTTLASAFIWTDEAARRSKLKRKP